MINRVVLVGRLTRDVEVRKTQSGLSVAQFTVACDRRGSRDANGQSQADFIGCVAWRQTADFLAQYAKKGNLVGVEGRIQTRNYDDRDGKRVYVTEVLADSVQLLESRRSREDNGGYSANNNYDNNGYNNNSYSNNSYGNNNSSYNSNNSYGGNNGGYNNNSYDNYNSGYGSNNDTQSSNDDFNNGDSLVISSDDLPF